VDEVELSDGRAASREIVHHPGAAAVVPLLDDGRVIMIRQYRQGAGKVLWELAEEVGQTPGELVHPLSTYTSPGFSTELIHIFLARDLREVDASEEEDEIIRAVQVPLSTALEMVRRGEVRNAAAVCGLLAAADRLRENT
jgi:ADP-ribose pyrophosphatase